MLLHATVSNCNIDEGLPSYDQITGAEKTTFWFNMRVIENETNRIFEIQIEEGHTSFDKLRKLMKQNTPADKLREAAKHLRNNLPQMGQQIELEILKTKVNKDDYPDLSCRLVCRFIQIVQKNTA